MGGSPHHYGRLRTMRGPAVLRSYNNPVRSEKARRARYGSPHPASRSPERLPTRHALPEYSVLLKSYGQRIVRFDVEKTRLSSKGQVILPKSVRNAGVGSQAPNSPSKSSRTECCFDLYDPLRPRQSTGIRMPKIPWTGEDAFADGEGDCQGCEGAA